MTYYEECKEWQSIADEMITAGKSPTAYDVSREQKRRMWARGSRPMTYEEIVSEVTGGVRDSETSATYTGDRTS